MKLLPVVPVLAKMLTPRALSALNSESLRVSIARCRTRMACSRALILLQGAAGTPVEHLDEVASRDRIIPSRSRSPITLKCAFQASHCWVRTILDRYGVAIRAGTHCPEPLLARFGVTWTARGSFAMYNTVEETTDWSRRCTRPMSYSF